MTRIKWLATRSTLVSAKTLAQRTSLWVLGLIVLSPCVSDAIPRLPQDAATPSKTAAETFKNIQVLKTIPASELIPAMRYIATSLGVGCDFCHDTHHFDSDDKQEKKTARKMMEMMFAIDQDSFKGKPEVTCYTCHAGSKKPVTTPSLPGESVAPAWEVATNRAAGPPPLEGATPAPSAGQTAPNPNWPPAAEIVSKYIQAIGGEKAIARVKTLSESGTVEISARDMHSKVQIDRKAPDKAITVVELPRGTMAHGFDGKTAWAQRGNDVDPVEGSERVQEKRWAAFYPGADISTYYTKLQVDGVESIDGQDAYRVLASPAGLEPEKLYFDEKAGFLVRVSSLIESPLGELPRETNYSDYREVHGIKVPGKISVVELSGTTTFQFDTIEANKPIDDSRFAMPLPQPGAK